MSKYTCLTILHFLSCFSASQGDVSAMEASSLNLGMKSNLDLEKQILDTNSSPSVASNMSQENPKEITAKPSLARDKQTPSKSVITYLYHYDKTVVEMFRNIMNDSAKMSNMSREHRDAIKRYVGEWDEMIHEPGTEDTAEERSPELGIPSFFIPKELHKMYKIVRMMMRVGVELPVILKLKADPFWEEIELNAMNEEIRCAKFVSSFEIFLVARKMLKLSQTYFNHPHELYPEHIIAKIAVKDLVAVATSAGWINQKESIKWISFAKDHVTKRISTQGNPPAPKDTTQSDGAQRSHGDSDEPNSKIKFSLAYINILKNIYSFKHDISHGSFEEHERDNFFPALLSEENDVEQSKKYSSKNSSSISAFGKGFWSSPQLCNGIDLRDLKEIAALKCRYDRLNTPWLYLMPARVEEISIDPPILLFHNVLTESKMKLFQNMAFPLAAETRLLGNESNFSTEFRSVSISILTQHLHEIMMDASRITGYLSGCEVMEEDVDAEAAIVNIYLPGDFVHGHDDRRYKTKKDEDGIALPNEENIKAGPRMSTVIYYLNDVEEGGRTAFRKLGVSVNPEKGSALIFSTLKNTGEQETRVEHEGCPVISGVKWIFTRWISYNSQLFKKPCPLKKKKI